MPSRPSSSPRALLAALSASLLLAACATGPKDNITLIPDQLDSQTQKQGMFTQPVKWTHVRPGCQGQCPKLVVDSLAFPGHDRLTTLVDHALALMTWTDQERPAPYDTIKEYESYLWKTAGQRDETDLNARTRYRNSKLTVVELNVGQYKTGMAHGMAGTQFINWDNRTEKVLTLSDLLRPGQAAAFDDTLRAVHADWVRQSPAANDDPENFMRMWPYAPSDNVALTDMGLVVKYQPYEIAPYSSGEPELLIPYARLNGILKPQFLPTGA